MALVGCVHLQAPRLAEPRRIFPFVVSVAQRSRTIERATAPRLGVILSATALARQGNTPSRRIWGGADARNGGLAPVQGLGEAEFGFDARDELPPLLVGLQVRIEAAEEAVRGPVGVLVQEHVRLRRRTAGLAVVAGLAGGHDVLPGVRASAVPGQHVVQRPVPRLLAAILALEVV